MISLLALLQPFSLVIPQNNVVERIGCGTGCHIKFQQLSPMEEIDDGWRKVKVKSATFIWDYETNQFEQKSFRGKVGSGVSESWNYANCQKKLFTRRSENYSSKFIINRQSLFTFSASSTVLINPVASLGQPIIIDKH